VSSDCLDQIEDIRSDRRQASLKLKRGLTTRVSKGWVDITFTDGRLLYSCKTFIETTQCPDPMTIFPSSNVSLALRFFNHLTHEGASKLSSPTVIELEVDRYDKYDSIRKAIVAGFKTASHDNSKALSKTLIQGKFDMQL
jgi:hypothetical protein